MLKLTTNFNTVNYYKLRQNREQNAIGYLKKKTFNLNGGLKA